jgi:hypothetical protein
MGAIWERLKSVILRVVNASFVMGDLYINGLKKAVKGVLIAFLFILPLLIIGVWFNVPSLVGTYFLILGFLLTFILFAAFPLLCLARSALETFPSLRKNILSILMVLFWFLVIALYFYVVPVSNNPRLIPLVILLFGVIALGSIVFSVKLINPRVIVIVMIIILTFLGQSFFFPETSHAISDLFRVIDRGLSDLLTKPKQINPVTAEWFDFKTGKPLLYYANTSPCEFEFFDKAGYHPQTGDLLKPAILPVREQWLECSKRNSTSQAPNAETKLEPHVISTKPNAAPTLVPPSQTQPNEQARRLQDFKSLVKADVDLVPGIQNILIFVATSGPTVDFAPGQLLYNYLSSEKAHLITDGFRNGLLTNGYFDELYEGNRDFLKIAATSTRVDSVILGRLNYTFRRSSSVANDVVCEIAFDYKVIAPTGGLMKSDVIPPTIYPSYSESAALRGAIKSLGKQFSERLAQNP